MNENNNENANTATETITYININTNNNIDINANTNTDMPVIINAESDDIPLYQLLQNFNLVNTFSNNDEVLPTYEETYMNSNRGEIFETGSDYGNTNYDGVSNFNQSTLDCTFIAICCEGLTICLSGLCSV